MENINRDDMLELTRRMTVKRNCFSRIAGAYIDEEGFIDGTFNRHFLKLRQKEQETNLAIAKAIPFSKTNVNLREYRFAEADEGQGSLWQLLMGLRTEELKNDGVLDIIYEVVAEKYQAEGSYAVYFFYGSYDVPLKGSDNVSQWESEEVYRFIICAFCPTHGDYEAGEPECGFIFPAFKERSGNEHFIDIFQADDKHPHKELLQLLFQNSRNREE